MNYRQISFLCLALIVITREDKCYDDIINTFTFYKIKSYLLTA